MTIWHKLKEAFVGSDAASLAEKRMRENEDRSTVRKPQRLVDGFIWSERMAASKICNIRNVSMTGARIDLVNGAVNAQTLQGPLTLYIPAERKEIDCEVMWRTGSSIGLRFVGAYRAPTRKYVVRDDGSHHRRAGSSSA